MVISGSTKLDSWVVSSWKEGIDYEETLAPMARYYGQIHFDYGTRCKARMEATLDGREDNFSKWCKTKCTWSSH